MELIIMSFSKTWKLALIALSAIFLAACAGSRQGDSESESEAVEYNEDGTTRPSAKAQKVDEDELKETKEAAAKTMEENHDLRRQIFEAKTQLGISTTDDSSSTEE